MSQLSGSGASILECCLQSIERRHYIFQKFMLGAACIGRKGQGLERILEVPHM